MAELTTPPANAPRFSRKNPYLAELIRHDRLTKEGSSKDTRHFVLNLADSGLTYTPGDSLGAFGMNPPPLVDEIIGLLKFDPSAPIKNSQGGVSTLREVLLRDYTLKRANRKIMNGLAERISQGEQRNRLMEIVDNNELLSAYTDTRDYVDILT